jgi:hypothetical protein
MSSAQIQAQVQDRGWRRRVPAGAIELLNRHWHNLRGVPSPRSCPGCAANVSATDYAVRQGGELYHPDCAPKPRPPPDAALRLRHPRGTAKL